MGVNIESLEEVLNQITSSGAYLSLIADSDGLPIATKVSEGSGIREETEEALSAFASVILEIGQTICQEIKGNFKASLFYSSDQVIIASVIPAERPYVFISLAKPVQAFNVFNEVSRLSPLVSQSMVGKAVAVEEIAPPEELVAETGQKIEEIITEGVVKAVSEEDTFDQRVDKFFVQLELDVNSCGTKNDLGDLFLKAKRDLTMVLGTLSAVGFHMNTFAVKAKKKRSSDTLEKLRREAFIKMDHWKQLLHTQKDL